MKEIKKELREKFSKTCRSMILTGVCKGTCCGVVPIKKEIVIINHNKIQVKPKEIHYFDSKKVCMICEDMLCPFLNRRTRDCAIHEDRPEICRNYGLIPILQCPYINMKGNKRSEAKQRRQLRLLGHEIDNKIKIMENSSPNKDYANRR